MDDEQETFSVLWKQFTAAIGEKDFDIAAELANHMLNYAESGLFIPHGQRIDTNFVIGLGHLFEELDLLKTRANSRKKPR